MTLREPVTEPEYITKAAETKREGVMQMNKKLRKWILTAAVMCFTMISPAIVSYAADGILHFSDPTGKVGENITVTGKMEANGSPIGDGQVTVTYDPAKLEFVSGTNAEGGDGTITLFAAGTGTETELQYEMVFKALAEGSTTLDVSAATAYMFDNSTLNLQLGSSTVTIEPGDGTAVSETENGGDTDREVGEANIEIAGTTYAVYENFTDALIPDGFTRSTITYNGEEHSAVVQDNSGKSFVFLVTGENDPVMALYDEKNSKFVAAEQVIMGDEFYLLILGEGDGSSLPEQFAETTLELNGTIFPAWQNMEATDYYLVNALSSNGNEGFYEYDSVEGTYQRYVVSEKKTEEKKAGNGLIAKAQDFVDQYFMIVAAATAAVVLLLLIVIIILSVKLGHSNAELDAMYDDFDEEDDLPKVKKNSRKQFVRQDEEEEDDYLEDDFEDDDYDDDTYDDEYDDEDEMYDDDDFTDDEYDDYEDDDYEDDDYEDDDYDDDYDDEYEDDDYDDYDVEEDRGNAKKKNDYGIDFIDI